MPKVIIVSGGSDGLGKAIAKKLSSGHQVIILSHNQEKLALVAKELACDLVAADVSDFTSVSQAINQVISKYNHIDTLVNCAGIWLGGSLVENDPSKIEEIFKVNSLGTIFLTKSVLPAMISQNSGQIINIISQDGITFKKDRSVYHASKWAVTGFTKCLQEDLIDTNIRVTGLYPGLMKTNLFQKSGVQRDLSNALELDDVAGLVEYVINLKQNASIPDVGIVPILNNISKMDDNTSQINSLDLNPDMMTTQSSIPVVASPIATPSTNIPPVSSGVIDITPGASAPDLISATPQITAPSSNPIFPPMAPVESPDSTNSFVDPVTSVTNTPQVPPQIESTTDLSQQLSQPGQPVSVMPTVSSEPTPSAISDIPANIPTAENPLSENPDLVKLIK